MFGIPPTIFTCYWALYIPTYSVVPAVLSLTVIKKFREDDFGVTLHGCFMPPVVSVRLSSDSQPDQKKEDFHHFRTSIICCLVVISQLSWVRFKQPTVFLLNNTIYRQTRLSMCGSRSCQSQEKSCSGHLSHVRTLESSNISLKNSFVIATGPVVSVAFSSHSASNTG